MLVTKQQTYKITGAIKSTESSRCIRASFEAIKKTMSIGAEVTLSNQVFLHVATFH